mgnify:CR=1 FL=1
MATGPATALAPPALGDVRAARAFIASHPEVDVLIVPVGGGSGAAGASIAATASDRRIEVIGVQSEGASAAPTAAAWKLRERLRGKRVALWVSGANATAASIEAALAAGPFVA